VPPKNEKKLQKEAQQESRHNGEGKVMNLKFEKSVRVSKTKMVRSNARVAMDGKYPGGKGGYASNPEGNRSDHKGRSQVAQTQ